jgi:hypothetical protein
MVMWDAVFTSHPTPVVGVFLKRHGVVSDLLVVNGGTERERGLRGRDALYEKGA